MRALLRILAAVARRRPRPVRFIDLPDHLRRDIGLPPTTGAGFPRRGRAGSPL